MKKNKVKIQPLGDLMLELEEVLDKISAHDLQWGEILGLVKSYLEIHRPDLREEYVNGGHPMYYYGPVDGSSVKKETGIISMILDEYKLGRPRKKWASLMNMAEEILNEKKRGS